jgi:hypothetical protein
LFSTQPGRPIGDHGIPALVLWLLLVVESALIFDLNPARDDLENRVGDEGAQYGDLVLQEPLFFAPGPWTSV